MNRGARALALITVSFAAFSAPGAFVPPLLAQDYFEDDSAEAEEKGHTFGVEAAVHFRDSDAARFPSPFPFAPSMLPIGQERGFMEVVEPGEHFELSAASVFYRGEWGKQWGAKVKIDLYDRYDRNPTSEDDEWDLDEIWLRYGPEIEPGETHEGYSAYVKIGKFPKFERQDDRHLQSYGLISTSFNRMEDVGVEAGFDIGRFFYIKASVTQGNPVFFRDPNALAGDNGTPILNQPNPEPPLGAGIPILYDADVVLDDLNFDDPEGGIGLGLRLGGDAWNLDLMAFRYERDLADTVELEGTFYGGDLDLLQGPLNLFPLTPLTSREKEEIGFNIWLYAGGLSVFGQYVDQDLGGLERDGFEIEVAYDIELPYFADLWGRQLLPFIAPAIRYSEIDPQFGTNPDFPFPAPSVFWDWDKLDIGLRLGLIDGLADMTVEYSDNTFVRGGQDESADEFLATFRLMWDWQMASESAAF